MNRLIHRRQTTFPRGQALGFALLLAIPAFGQLNQNCTVSVLNRTVPVNADGSWVLPNIPANFGQVKARATCIQNGLTSFGESDFFTISPNLAVNLPAITLGNTTLIPVGLEIVQTASYLTAAGQTSQLTVTANYPDGSTKDVTAAAAGTNYTVSNPAIATISSTGLLTALSSGTVVIQANNDGATGIVTSQVILGGSSHQGIPDSWSLYYGLNPLDPVLAAADPDRDGLTNLQEFQLGTNPSNPDTDGDGLSDGDEVNKYHTNPLLADTDGDEIPDGVEITTGTNPLDPSSYDLQKATLTSTLTPASFTLKTSIANPVLSIQLTWKVALIDGKTTLDLTADPRTTFKSSDLTICNFEQQPGQIFSGSSVGNCVITLSQNTLSVSAAGSVSNFTPVEISTLNVPGAVAVDVAGGFAYVATGATGLVVVDVNDRTKPFSRGTLGGLGNVVAVRASGQNIFAADQNGFVRIVSAQNPDAPVLLSSLAITGSPAALAIHGSTLAVAAATGGVSLVDVGNSSSPLVISQFATPSPAQGVDFDPQTGIAAAAMGTGGLQLADISHIATPTLRGLLAGGDVRRVLLRSPAALLADVQRSVTAVNITSPDAPIITTSLSSSLGGVPVDIAACGNIAITADITFGRAIPIVGIANPLNPAAITFWTLPSPGYSTSVAVDISFGYVIIPATGTLRILKYQDVVDTFGIPPTISLTSPSAGTTLIQGQTLTVSANAVDDVAVASVNFNVAGASQFTVSSAPFQFTYTVPATASSLTFGATAVDYGNNVGTAQPDTVSVIPDPLTTVIGRVLDASHTPVAGAPVSLLTFTTTSAVDGTFSIAGVPTIKGNLIVLATSVVQGIHVAGYSLPLPPVLGGVTAAGDITLRPAPLISTLLPKSELAGTTVAATITGFNLVGSAFSFSPAGGVTVGSVTIDPSGTSATMNFTTAASASGRYVLIGTNAAGPSISQQQLGFIAGSAPYNALTVPGANANADPDKDGLTNAQEIAAGTDPLNPDTDGDGYVDGLEALLGSNPLDPASIPVIRPANGYLTSLLFSVENKVSPIVGPRTYAISGLTISTENRVSPIVGPRTYAISGLTFSMENGVSPTIGPRTYAISGLTFSMENGISPIIGPRTYAISGLTFSLKNGVSPIVGPRTYAISGLTFSMENGVSPIIGPRTYAISGLTFSMLNKVSPISLTPPTYAVVGTAFSILNGTASSTLSSTLPSSTRFVVSVDPTFLAEALARGAQTRNGKSVCTDSDRDGLCDSDELIIGTNPFVADSDGDGYPDGLELILGSDPLNPRSIPDIRPPGYYATPPVSIFNTIPLVMLIPRPEGAINAKPNR